MLTPLVHKVSKVHTSSLGLFSLQNLHGVGFPGSFCCSLWEKKMLILSIWAVAGMPREKSPSEGGKKLPGFLLGIWEWCGNRAWVLLLQKLPFCPCLNRGEGEEKRNNREKTAHARGILGILPSLSNQGFTVLEIQWNILTQILPLGLKAAEKLKYFSLWDWFFFLSPG